MKNLTIIENPEKSLFKIITSSKELYGGVFTVKSLKTGAEYSYRIIRETYNNKLYTKVSLECNNRQWVRLGNYFNGNIWQKGIVQSTSAKAIAWVLGKVENGVSLAGRVEIYHEGKCLRCGRSLTDSESIKSGMGPTCRNL